jgi:Secretion system C-terminal sorting domain
VKASHWGLRILFGKDPEGLKYTYKYLKADPSVIGLDANISSFFTTADAPTSGHRKLWDIEMAINAANYSSASTLLGAFTPANYAETNTKSYYTILIAYLQAGIITAEQRTQLLTIANECPHTDGLGVYGARELYNRIIIAEGNAYAAFADDCNPSGLYKKPLAAKSFSATVYPNPAHDRITVAFTGLTAQQVILSLTTVDGKIAMPARTAIVVSNSISIPINVPPGLYLLQITTPNNERVIEKVLIE